MDQLLGLGLLHGARLLAQALFADARPHQAEDHFLLHLRSAATAPTPAAAALGRLLQLVGPLRELRLEAFRFPDRHAAEILFDIAFERAHLLDHVRRGHVLAYGIITRFARALVIAGQVVAHEFGLGAGALLLRLQLPDLELRGRRQLVRRHAGGLGQLRLQAVADDALLLRRFAQPVDEVARGHLVDRRLGRLLQLADLGKRLGFLGRRLGRLLRAPLGLGLRLGERLRRLRHRLRRGLLHLPGLLEPLRQRVGLDVAVAQRFLRQLLQGLRQLVHGLGIGALAGLVLAQIAGRLVGLQIRLRPLAGLRRVRQQPFLLARHVLQPREQLPRLLLDQPRVLRAAQDVDAHDRRGRRRPVREIIHRARLQTDRDAFRQLPRQRRDARRRIGRQHIRRARDQRPRLRRVRRRFATGRGLDPVLQPDPLQTEIVARADLPLQHLVRQHGDVLREALAGDQRRLVAAAHQFQTIRGGAPQPKNVGPLEREAAVGRHRRVQIGREQQRRRAEAVAAEAQYLPRAVGERRLPQFAARLAREHRTCAGQQ